MNTTYEEGKEVIDEIAKTQGEVYELACELGYDLEDFSNTYLSSDFCLNEMDCMYSVYQITFPEDHMKALQYELEEKGIQLKKASNESVSNPTWIGRMYRYLHYSMGL